jgi:hypothetical protein
MRRPILPGTVLVAVLAVLGTRAEDKRLTSETTLRTSPGTGEILGMLTAQAPVTVIERQGDWVRVRVEGWVRAESLPWPAPAVTITGEVTPVPAPVPTPVPTAARTVPVEGILQVKLSEGLRKKKLTGSGQQVWLVPSSLDLEAAGEVSPADEAKLQELDAEAARIAAEAAAAFQGSNFAAATRQHDALMAKRREVIEARVGLLAHHGRARGGGSARRVSTASATRAAFHLPPRSLPAVLTVRAPRESRLDLESGSRRSTRQRRRQGRAGRDPGPGTAPEVG